MMKHHYVTSFFFISALTVAGCQRLEGEAADLQQQVEAAQPWGQVGQHDYEQLNWQRGEGTLAGIEVAVVGHDAETGATAMYLKIPPKAPTSEGLHVHSANAHALVLDGSLSIEIDGKEIVGKKGDYFFIPANIDHTETKSDPIIGATVFMVTEGKFDTIAVNDQVKVPAPDLETWGDAQLHSADKLQWQSNVAGLDGVSVAVVNKNRNTGGTVMFLRIDKAVADDRLHHHTTSSHTVVLQGQISQVDLDGNRLTMSAGDYFRGAAFDDHQDTAGDPPPDGGATLVFMITDGEFGTEYIN